MVNIQTQVLFPFVNKSARKIQLSIPGLNVFEILMDTFRHFLTGHGVSSRQRRLILGIYRLAGVKKDFGI